MLSSFFAHRKGQPNRSSKKTSCSKGTFTPVLGCGRFSRRDSAKALAALHAKTLLHLHNQAAFTLFRIRTGAVPVLALTRHLKNSAISLTSPSLHSQNDKQLGLRLWPISGKWPPSSCMLVPMPHLRRATPRLVVPSQIPSLCQWPIGRLGTSEHPRWLQSFGHRAL